MNLCGGRVAGSMTVPSSIPTRKPDQFPAGLRVLVVDDDPTCLLVLERMLQSCQYEVMKCDRAEYALNELRRDKNGYDVVISDVHMPDMDGFKLLEHIGLEMDLPVIMMSADDGKDVVMKGVIHGACDYLIKPVRMEALKNIWQHVVRKKKKEWKDVEQQSGSLEEGDKSQKLEDGEYSSPMSDGKCSKRKLDDEDADEKDDASTMKKARVVWSIDLHQQFVAAVNHLGIEKAFPKKILDLMNVPGLTRENVASHLQKYRLYLRRLSGVSHHPGLLSSPFMMSPQDPRFGTISPLGGIDLQTFAAGQLRGSTLARYQPGLSRSTIRPGASSAPFVDQTNLFNPGNPKSRFGEMQSPMRHTVSPTGISSRTRTADSSQAMSYCAASQAYDMFNQLPQHTSAIANNSDVSPSILLNGNSFATDTQVLQQGSSFFPCHFGDDDLSAFLKQQQQRSTGSVEGEFDIDVCILDNIPV